MSQDLKEKIKTKSEVFVFVFAPHSAILGGTSSLFPESLYTMEFWNKTHASHTQSMSPPLSYLSGPQDSRFVNK